MPRKKPSYWNSEIAMRTKIEFAGKTSAELLELQRGASIYEHARIQAELTRRKQAAAREERERRRERQMTTGDRHAAILRAEKQPDETCSAESQSYGVRCNGCGEWETACRCEV